MSLALGFVAERASAADKINFVLNWVPGGDHSPIYWAREQGWYADVDIELVIEEAPALALPRRRWVSAEIS